MPERNGQVGGHCGTVWQPHRRRGGGCESLLLWSFRETLDIRTCLNSARSPPPPARTYAKRKTFPKGLKHGRKAVEEGLKRPKLKTRLSEMTAK